MIRRFIPNTREEVIRWYERYVSPLALVAGFLLDTFVLFDRVDVLLGNVIFLTYILVAGTSIALLYAVHAGRIKNSIILSASPFLPLSLQFSLGALFSGYLSLYSRSAGAALSWVFVFGLAALLIGNERFRARYSRLPFQVAVYFTSVFSFLIFFLPVIVKKIGPLMFLLSGVVSILFISAFITMLRILGGAIPREQVSLLTRTIAGIFLTFNILYFSQLIPPLPLALKEADVYHFVQRQGLDYVVRYEEKNFFQTYLNQPVVHHRIPGEPVYVFTAVFAPSGLATAIRHEWQYYDPISEQWVTKANIRFAIQGGRDGGFRGYSEKADLAEGEWRVNVRTDYGHLLGRVRFTVDKVSGYTEQPLLIDGIR